MTGSGVAIWRAPWVYSRPPEAPAWDDGSQGDLLMKRFLTLMLGLGLVLSTTSLFAQETKGTTKKEKKNKSKKKRDTTSTEKKS